MRPLPDAPDTTVPPRTVAFALHALGSSRREYEPLAARLADELDVVGIDLPGFGDEPASAGTDVEEMVALVEARIRAHGAARWLLVGHSMGGKIASIVAARTLRGDAHLFGLAGVVLLAASPPSPEPMSDEQRAHMLEQVADGGLDAAAAQDFLDANTGAPLADDLADAARADLLRTDREAWIAWLRRGSLEDWSGPVGELDLPALVVAGGADGPLGPEAQRALHGAVYPRAEQLVLDGAGHLLPLERPDEVADAIRRFHRTRAGLGPAVSVDFAAVLASERTAARTRGILARRAIADIPDRAPEALDAALLETLRAVADRIVPQDGASIDLAARLDAQLAAGADDGWRNALLPSDIDAYRTALGALDGFTGRSATEQDDVLRRIADGDHPADRAGLSGKQMQIWFEDLCADLVRIWTSHPASMERIGYDGFANGGDGERMQGWVLLGADEREGWEPAMPDRRTTTTTDGEAGR